MIIFKTGKGFCSKSGSLTVPALEWIKGEGTLAIFCSQVNLILNGLSQISTKNLCTKSKFIAEIISGLGALLTIESRTEFLKKVLELSEEFVTQPSLYLYFDERKDCIENFITDISCEYKNDLTLPLILTNQIQHAMSTLHEWLQAEKSQHLLLVGPHGSAKT